MSKRVFSAFLAEHKFLQILYLVALRGQIAVLDFGHFQLVEKTFGLKLILFAFGLERSHLIFQILDALVQRALLPLGAQLLGSAARLRACSACCSRRRRSSMSA